MDIVVTDRQSIEQGILILSSYVVISIHDSRKRPAKIQPQSGLRAVLALGFDDAEPTSVMAVPPEIKMMTPDQAALICKFVVQHKADVGTIVVHCEQGMSRSPAIAAAISEAIGVDSKRFWREYQPNRHVYHTVMDAFERWREVRR